MYRYFLVSAVILSLFGVRTACAQVKSYNAKLTSTNTIPSAGRCTTPAYSSACATLNGVTSCTCVAFSGNGSGNRLGKMGGSTFEVNLDNGALLNGVVGQCRPFYADVVVIASKDAEIIDMQGTSCTNKNGTSSTIAGGFSIAQSELLTAGWGTVSGTGKLTKGILVTVKLTLKGNAF